jgi:thioredoxin-related protein
MHIVHLAAMNLYVHFSIFTYLAASKFIKMKTIFSIFFLAFFGVSLQPPSDYKAHNDGFLVDLQEAYNESQKTGKPIMALFTGSDWCSWCIRLTNDVLSKPEFKQWAKENVILLELDFPRKKTLPDNIKAQNSSLRETFMVRGFPTVWLFNINKNSDDNNFSIDPLGQTGYNKSVAEFLEICEGYMGK